MAFRSAAVRDGIVLVAVFGFLLGGLFLYTGTWPPAVIVESASMMHPDHEVTYGRVGTIDPGDLVLVRSVTTHEDVRTFAEAAGGTYGTHGDVIVFYSGDDRTSVPIIHRAMMYVERATADGEAIYRVRWDPDAPCPPGADRTEPRWCEWGPEGISVDFGPALVLSSYTPVRGGFVTKGDNNPTPDQESGLSRDAQGVSSPVQLEWIDGKARAELPWLGLIKLALAPTYNQESCASYPIRFHFFEESARSGCQGWYALGHAYAPRDLWVMLFATLFALIGLPLMVDGYRNDRARRAATVAAAAPAAAEASEPSSPEGGEGEQRL